MSLISFNWANKQVKKMGGELSNSSFSSRDNVAPIDWKVVRDMAVVFGIAALSVVGGVYAFKTNLTEGGTDEASASVIKVEASVDALLMSLKTSGKIDFTSHELADYQKAKAVEAIEILNEHFKAGGHDITKALGHKGPLTESVQWILKSLNYDTGGGYLVDGRWGDITQRSVVAFKKDTGLNRDKRIGVFDEKCLLEATRLFYNKILSQE